MASDAEGDIIAHRQLLASLPLLALEAQRINLRLLNQLDTLVILAQRRIDSLPNEK